ncbi:hypothetical protein MACH10_23350 [Thalassospira tepidiphila]|uniref:hypothetical protein n=1 Tax=Thalassospira tepidiphila TaxID=393657 RepID=UPI00291DF8C0|nr:hypothetical protein MACH10_23350 [Thalassospira tepidiphila]
MRYVIRPEQPEEYSEKAARELEGAKGHYEADPPPSKSFNFKVYKSYEIKKSLEEIFHGKCAYCETHYSSSQPMDVEHFRPKSAVAEDKEHPGYWWLAMSWDNLLPSCIDCNRKRKQRIPSGDLSEVQLTFGNSAFSNERVENSGKKDSFPILDTGSRAVKIIDDLALEKPLLLNPCEDDPDLHLNFYWDRQTMVSLIVPAKIDDENLAEFQGKNKSSLKGAASIQVYGLNRLGLVQARTEVLRKLQFLETISINLFTISEEMESNSVNSGDLWQKSAWKVSDLAYELIKEMGRMGDSSQPYSAMVRSWLKNFLQSFDN